MRCHDSTSGFFLKCIFELRYRIKTTIDESTGTVAGNDFYWRKPLSHTFILNLAFALISKPLTLGPCILHSR
jgi:hypothetical protein